MANNFVVTENPQLLTILKLLADGGFHSGEEIGVLLGVSRAAVWKHLQKLEGLGLQIITVKGRGYCIEGGLDLLDKELIYQLSSHMGVDGMHLDVHSTIDSTNSYLLRQPSFAKHVVLAEAQTAGRGRRGRTWVSPYAKNIYLSIGWGFEGGVAALEGLSLAIGVVIVRALQKNKLDNVQLKWPNDVLYKGRKLAGILVEMVGDPAGYCQVLVGVGINVSMPKVAAENIDQPWIDLREIFEQKKLPIASRNHLVAILIDELSQLLSTYARLGFSAYRQEWEGLNAYANDYVTLLNGNKTSKGIMRGVTAAGALRLETEFGEEVFHGGELSLRAAS